VVIYSGWMWSGHPWCSI